MACGRESFSQGGSASHQSKIEYGTAKLPSDQPDFIEEVAIGKGREREACCARLLCMIGRKQ